MGSAIQSKKALADMDLLATRPAGYSFAEINISRESRVNLLPRISRRSAFKVLRCDVFENQLNVSGQTHNPGFSAWYVPPPASQFQRRYAANLINACASSLGMSTITSWPHGIFCTSQPGLPSNFAAKWRNGLGFHLSARM